MAQSPMESTIRDFWKMIVERECRVVVMLCGLEEDGNVCYHKLCLVNNNDCVCYRKCVTSTGLLLLLLPQELRNTMNLVLNVNRRIAVVATLRGSWILLTKYVH